MCNVQNLRAVCLTSTDFPVPENPEFCFTSTVGFTIFPNIVALVHKISLHVECARDSRNISLIYLEVR